jgi:hypothetical protein
LRRRLARNEVERIKKNPTARIFVSRLPQNHEGQDFRVPLSTSNTPRIVLLARLNQGVAAYGA